VSLSLGGSVSLHLRSVSLDLGCMGLSVRLDLCHVLRLRLYLHLSYVLRLRLGGLDGLHVSRLGLSLRIQPRPGRMRRLRGSLVGGSLVGRSPVGGILVGGSLVGGSLVMRRRRDTRTHLRRVGRGRGRAHLGCDRVRGRCVTVKWVRLLGYLGRWLRRARYQRRLCGGSVHRPLSLRRLRLRRPLRQGGLHGRSLHRPLPGRRLSVCLRWTLRQSRLHGWRWHGPLGLCRLWLRRPLRLLRVRGVGRLRHRRREGRRGRLLRRGGGLRAIPAVILLVHLLLRELL